MASPETNEPWPSASTSTITSAPGASGISSPTRPKAPRASPDASAPRGSVRPPRPRGGAGGAARLAGGGRAGVVGAARLLEGERGERGAEERRRRAGVAELLEQDAQLDESEALAAVLLADGDARPAELAELGGQRVVVRPGF